MEIDTTKPSPSRIYDYVLGGHHNFEVDRLAAKRILQVTPSYPTWARLNRWFLQMVAERWSGLEHCSIVDLGSGLPTQGHFHSLVPRARVLYSDNDYVTVTYARQVLGDNPLVGYAHTDVREAIGLAGLLAEADRLFGGQRRVAVGFIGVSYFLDDASLERIARATHAWAAPGSVMALTYGDIQMGLSRSREVLEGFKRNSAELFMRDESTIRRLLAPWQVADVRPLATWLGMESLVQAADREDVNAEMYGVLLEHKG